jgi:hypothetical protein
MNCSNFCLLVAAKGPAAGSGSCAIFERRRPSVGLPLSTKFGTWGRLAWVDASFQLIEDHTH